MDVYIRELSCKSVSRIWSRLVSVSIDWEIYLYFEHSGFPIPWAMHLTPESISCSCRTWISFNILIFFFFKSRKSLNKIDTQSPTLNSICMWNIWGSKFNVDWYFGINCLIILPTLGSIMLPNTQLLSKIIKCYLFYTGTTDTTFMCWQIKRNDFVSY